MVDKTTLSISEDVVRVTVAEDVTTISIAPTITKIEAKGIAISSAAGASDYSPALWYNNRNKRAVGFRATRRPRFP